MLECGNNWNSLLDKILKANEQILSETDNNYFAESFWGRLSNRSLNTRKITENEFQSFPHNAIRTRGGGRKLKGVIINCDEVRAGKLFSLWAVKLELK